MSWFNLWDGLKTKTCRYLLQRYLGQFFENNLNLEQLKVDLYNGKAVVENISLKVKALNDLFEDQGWAFEVISGHIGCLTAMVPWNALMTNDSSLNISNLTITLRPVTRCQSGTTMLESMWSSVSSSMQMAEECMKQIDDDVPFLNHNNTLIGLEKFAETIDNVLNRIHANLTNTTINIECNLPKSAKQLIISFKANHIEYKNQTGYGTNASSNEESGSNSHSTDQGSNFTSLPMIAKHNLVTNELTIYTSEIFDSKSNKAGMVSVGRLCKIVEFKGCQHFKISVKQTENVSGPKINLEVLIGDIYFMLTPRQTHLLIRIFKGFDKVRPKERMKKKYSDLKTDIKNAPFNTKMTGIVEKDKDWCTEADVYRKSQQIYPDKMSKKNESVISSTSTNSITTSCSNAQIKQESDEKCGEILKFKLQIFKIVWVILHNDILFENNTNDIQPNCLYTNESFSNYLEIANIFFQATNKEKVVKECYIPIPKNNYLLLIVSSLLVTGNQQRFCNELSLKTTLSATTLDFSEILDKANNHLILFDRKKNCREGYHTRPEIILSHISSYLFKQNHNRSSNKIECTLDDCTTELDISIYDRLKALFKVSPFMEDDNTDEKILENDNLMDIQIKCKSLKLHLRFPIVNGGLLENRENYPCLKKYIRRDYLSFDFRNILIQCKSYICVIVDEIDGYYCDEANEEDIKVLQCSYQNKLDCLTENDKICLSIHNFMKDGIRMPSQKRTKEKFKSPFSSKCSYGYSSHIEGFHDSTDKSDFFLPGDTDEINEFCKNCKDSSNIEISAFVPNVKIVIESKKLYEIIYNRLNGDLFMWEPQSATIKDDNNVCSFELYVKEGICIIYTNVQDLEKTDQISPRGKLQWNLKDFRSFMVTALNNDKNLGYFCVQIKDIDVYHCGQTVEDLAIAWSDVIDTNLIRIISNIPKEKRVTNNRNEIISVVAELKKQPDKRLKRIKLAFGINGVNLLHKPVLSIHNWIYQLLDFLNITDYPIEAYEPYALVSEIQGHVWNFAMEYTPKYLSYRALLHIGYCSFSSNIIYPMTGCTLRLISEDCVLSIGQTAKAANNVEEFMTHISDTGLVPVLNVGLLNFSIHLNEKSKSYAKIDLRSSIHDMHLKTCFDSADALAQLIAYIANDKDLKSKDNNFYELKKAVSTPVRNFDHNNDETLYHINNLMADAVKDVNTHSNSKITEIKKKSFDISNILDFESNEFLESNLNCGINEHSLSQVQAELGATSSLNASISEEKEYHVIHEEDLFFMDNFGIEKIYVSEDPLQIVDNHFSLPSEKIDLLRPHSCFPIPEESYTLCEMTFTWHLFGGKDFPEFIISHKSTDNTRRGILGWNKLFEFVSKEWLKDIKRNQLPNILSGIGPTNAVIQLFQGFFDLFRLPLQQYNKDGRIIRGFQMGAQSFSARTAFAALEITSRIIHLLQ
ncbi:autophagy-related protein 2 homolog A, partial [Drosophila montana]|uniref:autophagy-related protein 2 homolog A n=1 Tax=Drosophila montana TaxID=40370 RepID=UPI00313D932C